MPSQDLLFSLSNVNHKTFNDASPISSLCFFTVAMTGYAGIVYHSLDRYLLHLPLQEAYVRVWIVDSELERDLHSPLIYTPRTS